MPKKIKAGDIIFFIKQCLKMALQNIILPVVYFFAKTRHIVNGLVVFADAHHDNCPISMEYIYQRLKSDSDFTVLEFFHNFQICGSFRSFKYSIEFMKLYAKAEFVFICDNFLPVSACKKRKDTTVIQLWHGCGAFKKFGYDTYGDIPKYYKGNVYKNYDIVTVSSDECINHFASAMRLDKSIFKPIGVSRTDAFFDEDFIERSKEMFFRENPNAKGKKVVLWAPTFRGNPSNPYQVGDMAVMELAARLFASDSWYFVNKSHPHMKKPVIAQTESDIPVDMIFPVADLLITDYSSVIYEYALFKKPILIFSPDLDEYKSERGFYLDFESLPAKIITNADELTLRSVEDAVSEFDVNKINKFLEKYMTSCDGKSTDRVIECVKEIKRQKQK